MEDNKLNTKVVESGVIAKRKFRLSKKVWSVFIGLILIILFANAVRVYFFNRGNAQNQVGATNTQDIKESWQRFYSTKYNFSIEFPCSPQESPVGSSANGTSDLYSCMSGTGGYIAEASSYSMKPVSLDSSGEQGVLEQMLSKLVSSSNYKLVTSSFSKFGDHQSIDYLLYDANSGTYSKGKNFTVTLPLTTYYYQFTVTSVSINDVDYDHFINSFQVTN